MEGLVTTYDETEDYRVQFQEAGDFIFVHVDFYNWSPSIYKEMVSKSPEMFDAIRDKGYALAFTYSDDKKFIKLWNKIKTCAEIKPFYKEEKEYYLGAWDLED